MIGMVGDLKRINIIRKMSPMDTALTVLKSLSVIVGVPSDDPYAK